MAYIDDAERRFVGTLVERVLRRDHSWDFAFSNGNLDVEHIWRLWVGGQLVVTDREDGISYGEPAALDAEALASQFLVGRKWWEPSSIRRRRISEYRWRAAFGSKS